MRSRALSAIIQCDVVPRTRADPPHRPAATRAGALVHRARGRVPDGGRARHRQPPSRPPAAHVDDGFEVCDLGSLNGTWVNGWRVDRATLRPGDSLRIGEVRVVLDPSGR